MSKIGRKPIDISKIQVSESGSKLILKNSTESVSLNIPDGLKIRIADKKLFLEPRVNLNTVDHTIKREINQVWGLYRALINNHVQGLTKPFEYELHINGLGFKAALSGRSLTFALGYSHKINFPLPQGVTVTVDKTEQRLLVKSVDKEAVGKVCSDIKALRPVEPYKGTGIKLAKEVILRKAGKTKSS